MASTIFTYEPTSGTGTTIVSVSASEMNADQTDKTATISLTNGVNTASVNLVQKYRPWYSWTAGTTIPATGGSLYFVVHTEYDIVFRSVPDWITIMLGDTVYAEGDLISSAVANNQTFIISAEENTGETRSVSTTFNMGHYKESSLAQYVSYFSFNQEGEELTKSMSLSPILVEADFSDTSATLTLTTENCTFDYMTTSTAGTFAITASTPDDNVITITFPANTSTSTRRGYLTFYLYDTDGDVYTATITVAQAAYVDEPYITVSPTTIDLDYFTGDTATMNIATNVDQVNITCSNNSYFPVLPTTGADGTVITATTSTYNSTYTAYTGTITIADNAGEADSKTVSIIQHYRPTIAQFASSTIPATGGSIYATMHSEYYTVVFRSVPDYITITDTSTGTEYVEGETIDGDTVDGHTFMFTATANESTESRSPGATFNMGHYIDGALADEVSYITFTQEGQDIDYTISVSPTALTYDYTEGGSATFEITTNCAQVNITNNQTGYFTVSPATGTNGTVVTATTIDTNYNDLDNTGTLTIADAAGNASSVYVGLTQYYRPFVMQVTAGDSISATGGELEYEIWTDYDFVFQNVPDWITIQDSNGATYVEDQVIPAATASNNNFFFIAAANTGDERSSGSFCMGHYIDGTLAGNVSYISFTQDSGSTGNLSIPYSVTSNVEPETMINFTLSCQALDTLSEDSQTTEYTATTLGETVIEGEFYITGTETSTLDITIAINNTTASSILCELDFNDGGSSLSEWLGPGEEATLTRPYDAGGYIYLNFTK